MKTYVLTLIAALTVTVVTAGPLAAPSPNSEATISFSLSATGGVHPTCKLTITSTKDISNYAVNGVKTEGVTTTSVTIDVKNGDVITVKSGTSTATSTVTGCLTTVPPEDDHDGDGHDDGPHDGDDHDGDGHDNGPHDGDDHDGDGSHTVDDHH